VLVKRYLKKLKEPKPEVNPDEAVAETEHRGHPVKVLRII
jgi:hypothetical protein